MIKLIIFMQDSWRKRRQKAFIWTFTILILAFVFYKAYPYLNPAPTCFDGKLNGDEFGIDCGGGCELVCNNEVAPLEVKYARAVKTEENLYDIVAMIQNNNRDRNIKDNTVNYKFSIYDRAGRVVSTLYASSTLPVGQTFPVIIQNVPLDIESSGNSISKVIAEIYFNAVDWVKVDPVFANNFFETDSVSFVQNRNGISQLSITLKNLTKATFRNVPVRVTLEDDIGNFIALNETLMTQINPSGNANLVFTWRVPLDTQNPKVTVYPIVSPSTDFR